MCELPQYQRLPLEDKSVPSIGQPAAAGESSAVAGPVAGSGGDRRGQVVEFLFEPRWPIMAARESAVGVMGNTREVSHLECKFAFTDSHQLKAFFVLPGNPQHRTPGVPGAGRIRR